jgi:hypothetical protein
MVVMMSCISVCADTTPPEIQMIYPEEGATEVSPDTVIRFSVWDEHGVDKDSIEFTVYDRHTMEFQTSDGIVHGDVEWVWFDNRLGVHYFFYPHEPLEPTEIICVIGGGLQDWEGNTIGEDFVWSFYVLGFEATHLHWGIVKWIFRKPNH